MSNGMKTLIWGVAILIALAFAGVPAANAGQAQAPLRAQETHMLYVMVYRAGPAWKPGQSMREQGLEEHGKYIQRLFDEGHVFAAGPLGADGGLMILHARDIASVEAMLADDPAIKAGVFLAEAKRFPPRFLRTEPLTDRIDRTAVTD